MGWEGVGVCVWGGGVGGASGRCGIKTEAHTYTHTYTTHTHTAQTCTRTRVVVRLNKCRLVMVVDMAIQRFLKGVQTA